MSTTDVYERLKALISVGDLDYEGEEAFSESDAGDALRELHLRQLFCPLAVFDACSGIPKTLISLFDPPVHSRMRYAHRRAMARAWRGDLFIARGP